VVRSLVVVMEYAAAHDFTFEAAATPVAEGNAALNDVTDLMDPAFMQTVTVVVRLKMLHVSNLYEIQGSVLQSHSYALSSVHEISA